LPPLYITNPIQNEGEAMQKLFMVSHVPDHNKQSTPNGRCAVQYVEQVAICSSARKAWDLCKEIGAHHVGYSEIELDRHYQSGTVIQTVYPNCTCNPFPPQAPDSESVIVNGCLNESFTEK
jgi:hypothetical protein